MNDYGRILWDAYPRGATGKFTYGYSDYRQIIRITERRTKLDGSTEIVTDERDTPMYLFEGGRPWSNNFLTFEPDNFGFEKSIFHADKTSYDIPDCTTYVAGDKGIRKLGNRTVVTTPIYKTFLNSDSVDKWSKIENGTITLTPSQAYSGSGIWLCTQNKAYSVKITVTDLDGTRSITSDRLEDEYYEIPYNGLKKVVIEFLKLHTGSFLKVVGVGLGRPEYIDDKILLEEPTITTNFDVTGQSLEADTLDFKILNEEGTINPALGERVTVQRETVNSWGEYKSNSVFYITDIKKDDEAIEISCEDYTSMLQSEKRGVVGEWANSNSIESLIDLRLDDDELMKQDYSYFERDEILGDYWFGFLEKAPIRDQLVTISTACGLAVTRYLYKNKSTLKFFTPELRAKKIKDNGDEIPLFTENNVLEGLSIENIEPISKVTYSWNNPKVNRKEVVEAWHAEIPKGETYWCDFSEPFSEDGRRYQLIKKIDANNPEKDVIEDVEIDDLENLLSMGDYEDRFRNPGSLRIRTGRNSYKTIKPIVGLIIKGYPYVDDIRQYSVALPAPSAYKSNSLDLGDLGIFVKNSTSKYNSNLKYIHSFDLTVKFKSLLDAAAGDYIRIETEKATGYGWISTKVDNMNGIYEYEAVIKSE